MANYVLIAGAWHGAWAWRDVLPALWRAGHRAYAVTLSGVGERAHQIHQPITLDTHIEDVTRVIEAEELEQVILLGHSYAGMVATGVADRLAPRIAHLVYLDAVVPLPGEAWSSGHTPETQAKRRDMIANTGVIAPADPADFGLGGEAAAWVKRRSTPQPGGVYDATLQFDAARLKALPRTFITCTTPALPTINASRQRVREQGDWHWLEIATGHDAMVSAPQELLAALLAMAPAR